MKPLSGKRILLGICGGIAAYKSAYLTRLFIKAGAEVQIIMTPDAANFVGPITFTTLSRRPALSTFTDEAGTMWHNHVEMGLWADMMVIAPLTASTLAKMATGQSDNLLLATYLSARCPVAVAPAMDLDMYQHPATRSNLEKIASFGNHIIPAGTGELASGLEGEGRMAEPEDIANWAISFLQKEKCLAGKHIVITAGPTREPIDPVRYLSNHSTGKMGIALADTAASLGATVTVILGPTHLQPTARNIQVIHTETALDMLEASISIFPEADVFIGAAAVADYTPAYPANQKLKKAEGITPIQLKATGDILAALGNQKKPNQLLIGFALETHEGEKHAREKMAAKNLDAIILNDMTQHGAGFGYDTNQVTIFGPGNKMQSFELKSKKSVAEDIIQHIMTMMHA